MLRLWYNWIVRGLCIVEHPYLIPFFLPDCFSQGPIDSVVHLLSGCRADVVLIGI